VKVCSEYTLFLTYSFNSVGLLCESGTIISLPHTGLVTF
jgi:hypothetical protein